MSFHSAAVSRGGQANTVRPRPICEIFNLRQQAGEWDRPTLFPGAAKQSCCVRSFQRPGIRGCLITGDKPRNTEDGKGRRVQKRRINSNPLFNDNRFKLGIFSANCDGGLTMSLVPERWKAEWDDIAAMSRIADEAGIEFILPVAKWRGYQGAANIYGKSFETLTHGAALAAITRQIAIFSTVHVPLVTPAFGAKAIATIDHISHGRAGLNIVCGWNQAEFDLHGVVIDQDQRYAHGLEWFQVWSKLLEGGPEFDWEGEFFKLR